MYLDSNGVTEIGASDLGNIIAGVTTTKKFGLQNDGNRVTGAITASKQEYITALVNGIRQLQASSEGLIKWALDTTSISCPFNATAALQSGGSLIIGTQYYFRITAFNANGETGGSIELTAIPTTGHQAIALSWSRVTGAAGYLIYRSTDQTYINARRHVIENPATVSWTDSGQGADPSAPYGFALINTDFDLPTENTSGGAGPSYGTAPTLGTANLVFSALQSGQQAFFWIGAITLSSTPESNNPRQVMISFTES